MILHTLRCAAAALLLSLGLPALAASSASSASSQAGSASVGSVSTSFEKSSDSSAGDRKTAAGDYRLLEMLAQAPNRPGMARMRLQALAEGHAEFFLYLPQQAAEHSQLVAGAVVSVKERPYGFEFAKQHTQEAFYLVVADDWLRELQTRPVRL